MEESNRLSSTCGKQPPGSDHRRFPWAVSISIKVGESRRGGEGHEPSGGLHHQSLPCADRRSRLPPLRGNREAALFVSCPLPSSLRVIIYRSFEEVQSRTVAYGGECIRGSTSRLPNHPRCLKPDVSYNKVPSLPSPPRDSRSAL